MELAAGDTELLIRGILALGTGLAILVGSVWLLLSLILGARMGYLVLGSVLFGILMLLSIIWLVTALGPKGPETTWFAVGVGNNLSDLSRGEDSYRVADYPSAPWREPAKGEHLADLVGASDTFAEGPVVTPVLDTAVSNAVSEEKKKREEVAGIVKGQVGLQSGEFSIVGLRFREAKVEGRESLIAVATAVPSARTLAGALPRGAEEGTVAEYLVEMGESIPRGEALVRVKTGKGDVVLRSEAAGKVLELTLREPSGGGEGDRVKEGVPLAVVDVTGQPGGPGPAEVAAVRVRGSIRTPALVYLAASTILFALHLGLLRRAERARRLQPQPA